ncbi:MAG: serine protease [Dehalococcoidia bacterium]
MRERLLLLIVAVALFGLAGAAAPAAADGRAHHDFRASGDVLPPRTPGANVEDVVLGEDGRTRVDDTSVFPFSAIAFIELEDANDEVFGSCTATFIGPDALLTAGHCLWDKAESGWIAEHIRVIPGKDGDVEPFGSEYASDWWVPDQYALTGSSLWDWGILKLPNDLLSLDTGWLGVTVADTETLEAPDFQPAIFGYPADKPIGTMWGMIRPAFFQVEDFRLLYDIDTAAGQSGSAIWSAADGPYLGLVVGIHTQSGLFNNGSRIDQELLDDLLAGCSAMECTIDVVTSPGKPPPPPPGSLPYRSYGVAIARD